MLEKPNRNIIIALVLIAVMAAAVIGGLPQIFK
jgi:hypothetical protein